MVTSMAQTDDTISHRYTASAETTAVHQSVSWHVKSSYHVSYRTISMSYDAHDIVGKMGHTWFETVSSTLSTTAKFTELTVPDNSNQPSRTGRVGGTLGMPELVRLVDATGSAKSEKEGTVRLRSKKHRATSTGTVHRPAYFEVSVYSTATTTGVSVALIAVPNVKATA